MCKEELKDTTMKKAVFTPRTTVSAGTRFIEVLPISPYYDGVIWATERAHIANGYPGTENFWNRPWLHSQTRYDVPMEAGRQTDSGYL